MFWLSPSPPKASIRSGNWLMFFSLKPNFGCTGCFPPYLLSPSPSSGHSSSPSSPSSTSGLLLRLSGFLTSLSSSSGDYWTDFCYALWSRFVPLWDRSFLRLALTSGTTWWRRPKLRPATELTVKRATKWKNWRPVPSLQHCLPGFSTKLKAKAATFPRPKTISIWISTD